MYYKITNKESAIYKKLHTMRSKEIKMEKDNIGLIEEKTGLKWSKFYGHSGQQHWNRVTNYSGFNFITPEKVDVKVWRQHKDNPETFVPNSRTKAGREMESFLQNLPNSPFTQIFDLFKIELNGKFTFPYVEIAGEIIILYLDNDIRNKDLIEITKTEFEKLFKTITTTK